MMIYNELVQINEFVKRARSAKIHAYIISHLKKEMPTMMGKAKAQQKLIDNLDNEFAKVCPPPSLFAYFGSLISQLLFIYVFLNYFLPVMFYKTGKKRVSSTTR